MKTIAWYHAICSMLCSLAAYGETIYVPSSGQGNSSSAAPFAYGYDASLRVQQVYGASSFSSVNQGGAWITGLAFRFEDTGTLGGGVSNIQINLSTTLRSVDGLSTTFAQNAGADDVRVFGPQAIGWFNDQDFAARFDLSTPFFYNPAAGNLLVDMRVFNSGLPFLGRGSFFMDASDRSDDTVSFLYAFNVNAMTGTADTLGLVTAFTVTPIPEPGVLALLISGLLTIFFAVWRHKPKG